MARDPRRAARGPRLDQPLEPRRSLRPVVDSEQFGRLSERIARFIGSWRFITWMTLFVALWLAWNIWAARSLRFDEWPFIGLTLLLSLQASYAAPLILLAQNRQTDRDRVTYEQDRARTERLLADTEYLAREVAALRGAVGETATRDFLRSELRDLVEELERARQAADAAETAEAAEPAEEPGTATAAGGSQEPGTPA